MPRLHRLASAWYGSQREQHLAIRHAVAAGEVAAAGDLLWARCIGAHRPRS